MKKNIDQKEFLTAKEAARYLEVSLDTLKGNPRKYPKITTTGLFRTISIYVKKYAMNNPPTPAELEKIKNEQGGQ